LLKESKWLIQRSNFEALFISDKLTDNIQGKNYKKKGLMLSMRVELMTFALLDTVGILY
jgi:hypothetical protein